MPELVEVEHFARKMAPLVSRDESKVTVECPSNSPPKHFLSKQDIEYLCKCTIQKVERKGKLIRVNIKLIDKKRDDDDDSMSFSSHGMLYFHMGMTGRISTPDFVAKLESLSGNDEYPPPHTHLILKSNGHEVAFSDPRKFGAVCLNDNGPLHNQWDDFAPDALDETISYSGLVGHKKSVKALLLDQRAVVSGVGNWIADEVLYQSKIHPDQNYLTEKEVIVLKRKLFQILNNGIQCLLEGKEFPQDWIFQSRWKKRSKEVLKDKDGHTIQFIQSGGRTSAYVPKIQKKFSRKGEGKDIKTPVSKKKPKGGDMQKMNEVIMKDEIDVKVKNAIDNEHETVMTRRSSRLAKRVKIESEE